MENRASLGNGFETNQNYFNIYLTGLLGTKLWLTDHHGKCDSCQQAGWVLKIAWMRITGAMWITPSAMSEFLMTTSFTSFSNGRDEDGSIQWATMVRSKQQLCSMWENEHTDHMKIPPKSQRIQKKITQYNAELYLVALDSYRDMKK